LNKVVKPNCVNRAGTPESTGEYVKLQYEAWGKVVKEIGLIPE